MIYILVFGAVILLILSLTRALYLPFFICGFKHGFTINELIRVKKILLKTLNRPANINFFKDRKLLGCVLIKFYLTADGQKTTSTIEKFYKLRYQLSKVKSSIDDKKAAIATHTLVYGSQLSIKGKKNAEPVEAMVIKNKEYLVLYINDEILDDRVNVYFWYQDAGYSFKSTIFKRENGHIWITHPKNIALVRRRQYTRVNLDIPVTFTVIEATGVDYHPEIDSPQIGQLKNISEGGLNLITSGQGRPDLIMKLRFELTGQPIIVCGVVKAVSYNKETNESILNLEFIETPPIKMYEPVLSYIYGLDDV